VCVVRVEVSEVRATLVECQRASRLLLEELDSRVHVAAGPVARQIRGELGSESGVRAAFSRLDVP